MTYRLGTKVYGIVVFIHFFMILHLTIFHSLSLSQEFYQHFLTAIQKGQNNSSEKE